MQANNIITSALLACSSIYDAQAQLDFDKLYQINDTVCGVVLRDGVQYAVFQGTCNLPGWEADFDVVSVKLPVFGKVHQGFYANLKNIRALVVLDASLPIVVSGHSKGAAEAVLFAAMLQQEKLNVSAVLFACPNAGEQQFADWCSKNLAAISFRNADVDGWGDPIPLTPISPYTAPVPHTIITAQPDQFLMPLEWHSAVLYLRAAFRYSSTLSMEGFACE